MKEAQFIRQFLKMYNLFEKEVVEHGGVHTVDSDFTFEKFVSWLRMRLLDITETKQSN